MDNILWPNKNPSHSTQSNIWKIINTTVNKLHASNMLAIQYYFPFIWWYYIHVFTHYLVLIAHHCVVKL